MSISCHFYGFSVSHTIFIHAAEFTSISIIDRHLSIRFTIKKSAFIPVTTFLCQLSFPILFIIFPLADIDIIIGPHKSALTIFFAIFEMSYIFISVSIFENALSRSFTIKVVTFINIAITETIYSLAILQIITPHTKIDVPISVFVFTLADALVICPETIISATVFPHKDTTSILHVIFPFAIVVFACDVGIYTISLTFALDIRAYILVTIII